jgi:hypothetical protein
MWFSRRAIGLHAVIVVIVPTFAGLCIWQVYRALGGNQLSWAYVFEWPFFAGYAVYMWWRLVHEIPADAGHPPGGAPGESPPDEVGAGPSAAQADGDDADERAAYNQYLGALAARDKRKQWR